MKKYLLTTVLFVLFAVYAKGQYYVIPYLNAGANPNGLNQDTEYPVGGGQPAGWTSIHSGSASTAQWSSTATIPFTFMFNGNAVSSYKVSTTGVLTFTTSAPTPPDVNNVALPAAAIPDNSICVWGIMGSGSNDHICYKTFGTAPNRQHWIIFSSYSEVGTSCYTYWAIVLEETTNKIFIVDQRSFGCSLSLTVGIQIDNTTAIQLNGSPNISAVAGSNAASVDNSFYAFIPGVQNTLDLAGSSLGLKKYLSLALGPFPITGKLENYGSADVTSFTLNYSVNGGATIAAPVTGVNIPSGGSYSFTHAVNWAPPASGYYTVKAWATDINGGTDQNALNDTVSQTVFVATSLAQKLVLFEQFTSSTCGPCATYNPAFNALVDANAGKVAAIKYQMNYPGAGNDPAYTTESTQRHTYYAVSGIPHVNMSGVVFDGHPVNVNQALIDNDYANNPGLFDMDLSYKLIDKAGDSANIKVTLNCTALVDLSSTNMRAHVVVIEKKVTHAAQSNGETEFFQVMRKMLPDANGTSITSQTEGQVTTLNLSYDFLPSLKIWDINQIAVVAFIQDNATKEIFQAEYAPVPAAPVGITAKSSKASFRGASYPNPAAFEVNIPVYNVNKDLSFRIMDVQGRTIHTEAVPAGKELIKVNVSGIDAGIYYYELSDNNISLDIQKLIVTH
jgi:thiol-disulfide isomerase/thioredoxin